MLQKHTETGKGEMRENILIVMECFKSATCF